MVIAMRTPPPLVLPFVLLLAAASPAQGNDKGGKPAGGASAKAPKAEPRKDDAKTAKDPVVVAIDKFRKAKVSTKPQDWRTRLPAPPAVTFDPARQYRWHLETSVGPIVVTLLPEAAPRHVTSVIYLARCGFYDGLSFPRVVKGFMAQGGSPTNDTAGDAGYKLDGEFASGQKHDKPGALSAANSGPGTDGSQFFLTFAPTPHLDGKHTVHGFVTEGLETLQAIEARGGEGETGVPTEKVTIVRTWITVVDAPVAPATPARDTKPPAGGP
jgi:peptidyl-prolyl cis-trans isomerase B (cyclophilin B)